MSVKNATLSDNVANADKLSLYFSILAVLAVFALRVSISNYQLAWDEEVYFQISKWWETDFIPYRDIFDHKPPFVYVYFKVFALFGYSMAPVRITPAILLIIAIFYTWSSLKDHVHFFFVPLLFGLLTSNYVTGTNLEIVYIPFILGTLVFGLREHVFLAALSAAIAVSIKYTCALDLLGVACFLFLYKGKTKTIVKAFALSMALFLVIHVPIYWYFHNLGVDVIYESIIRNMVYSGDH